VVCLILDPSACRWMQERGVAHIVEHLAFNATEQFENHAIIKFLESIGAEFGACSNAYTTCERWASACSPAVRASAGVERPMDIDCVERLATIDPQLMLTICWDWDHVKKSRKVCADTVCKQTPKPKLRLIVGCAKTDPMLT